MAFFARRRLRPVSRPATLVVMDTDLAEIIGRLETTKAIAARLGDKAKSLAKAIDQAIDMLDEAKAR